MACVDEFIPIFDKELEPKYQCNLCTVTGEANGLFNHVIQFKHREAFFHVRNIIFFWRDFFYCKSFLKAKFPNDPRFFDLNRDDMRRVAERYDELPRLRNRGECQINTFESDLLYPWPPKKAPWCVEQGGDGIVPPFARENISASGQVNHISWKSYEVAVLLALIRVFMLIFVLISESQKLVKNIDSLRVSLLWDNSCNWKWRRSREILFLLGTVCRNVRQSLRSSRFANWIGRRGKSCKTERNHRTHRGNSS